jgi:hypothetical protein
MKILMTLIFMVFTLDNRAFAQKKRASEIYTPKSTNKMSTRELKDQKEIYLENDVLITEYNKILGIQDETFYTLSDKNRLSISYHMNSNPESFSGISGLEINYLRRLANFQRSFWGLIYKNNSAEFSAVASNPTSNSSAPTTSDANPQNLKPDGAEQTITNMGIGYGHRFKMLLDFYPTQRVFEQLTTYVTTSSISDAFSGNNYEGYGLISDYEIQYRSSLTTYFAVKLSYNLNLVERPQLFNETGADHKLTYSWISIGWQFGYFF